MSDDKLPLGHEFVPCGHAADVPCVFDVPPGGCRAITSRGRCRQPESAHRPAPEPEHRWWCGTVFRGGGQSCDCPAGHPKPAQETLPPAPATSGEFGEPLDCPVCHRAALGTGCHLNEIVVALNACAGADQPQPGELARLREEHHEMRALLGACGWSAPCGSADCKHLPCRLALAERQRDDALLILKSDGGIIDGPVMDAFRRLEADGLLPWLKKEGLL